MRKGVVLDKDCLSLSLLAQYTYKTKKVPSGCPEWEGQNCEGIYFTFHCRGQSR